MFIPSIQDDNRRLKDYLLTARTRARGRGDRARRRKERERGNSRCIAEEQGGAAQSRFQSFTELLEPDSQREGNSYRSRPPALFGEVRAVFNTNLLKDDPDNRILKCAVAGRADLIVTGDRELLALKEFEGVRIYRCDRIST